MATSDFLLRDVKFWEFNDFSTFLFGPVGVFAYR